MLHLFVTICEELRLGGNRATTPSLKYYELMSFKLNHFITCKCFLVWA